MFPSFQNYVLCEKDLKDWKLTIFLELRSRKPVRFLEQIMPADNYPSIFPRQMEAIVYIFSRQMDAIV